MSKDIKRSNRDALFSSSNAFINTNTINPYQPGELSGLTFAIKDNIDVANEITGYGSPWWTEIYPKSVANAICLDQLLSAGAICLGKTHCDELARSLIGINPFYGIPLNPKAPNRVPGGSSSGSASAVACGLVDFAIGTDTGGSVRVPASNCGIWGYRPSHGLISVSGVATLAPSFDTVGIFANTGQVLERVMRILLSEDKTEYNFSSSIYLLDDVFEICDSQIRETIEPIVADISDYYSIEHLKLSAITDMYVNCEFLFNQAKLLLSTEIWNTFGAWVERYNQEYSNQQLSPQATTSFNNVLKLANRKDINDSLWKMKYFSRKLNEFLSGGAILCFPTTPDLAPRIDEVTDEFLSSYYPRAMGVTAISGFSRTPQITIPISQSEEVPIGLSFIAGYGLDMMLVNFCNELQAKLIGKIKIT